LEGIATVGVQHFSDYLPRIEVVDLVWKGLRPGSGTTGAAPFGVIEVVDLVWKGLRQFVRQPDGVWPCRIEVVDLVWKGLRHLQRTFLLQFLRRIEVVDLVWKGLRHVLDVLGNNALEQPLKSLTWFGRDCDIAPSSSFGNPLFILKSLTWFGRDCDQQTRGQHPTFQRQIEVVDLVWKGLRHPLRESLVHAPTRIEVVDLVWKGLRQGKKVNSLFQR